MNPRGTAWDERREGFRVAHMLALYRQEIDRVMGLCGVTSIAAIDRTLLHQKGLHT